jgi:hypothetical protein
MNKEPFKFKYTRGELLSLDTLDIENVIILTAELESISDYLRKEVHEDGCGGWRCCPRYCGCVPFLDTRTALIWDLAVRVLSISMHMLGGRLLLNERYELLVIRDILSYHESDHHIGDIASYVIGILERYNVNI